MQYIISFPKVYANAGKNFPQIPTQDNQEVIDLFFITPFHQLPFLTVLSTVIVWIVFTLKLSCYPSGISMMISDAHTHDETIEISSVKKDF